MRPKEPAPEQFYLIKNQRGFEEPVCVGTKEKIERLKADFEKGAALKTQGSEPCERVCYYIVRKHEWDLENCPLMPVDYS